MGRDRVNADSKGRRLRLLFAFSLLAAAVLGGSLFGPQCRRAEQPAARSASRSSPTAAQDPTLALDTDQRGLESHQGGSTPSVSTKTEAERDAPVPDLDVADAPGAAAVTAFHCYRIRFKVDVGVSGLPSTRGRNEFVVRLSGSSGGGVEFDAKNGIPIQRDIYGTHGEEWAAQVWTWSCASPLVEATFVTQVTDEVLDVDLTLDGPLGEWTCVFPQHAIHEDQGSSEPGLVMGGQAVGSIAPEGPFRWNHVPIWRRNGRDAVDLRGVCGASGVTMFLYWSPDYLVTCETLQMGEARSLPTPPRYPVLVELPLVVDDWCHTIEIAPAAAHVRALSRFSMGWPSRSGELAAEENVVVEIEGHAVTLTKPERRTSVRIGAWIPYVVRCREAAGSTFHTIAEFDPTGVDSGGQLVFK